MPARRPLVVRAIVLATAAAPRQAALAQSPFGHCADLYQLWMRYEWHFTLHSGQKARADIALERDCRGGGQARGVEELQKLLRRGLIPIPDREIRKEVGSTRTARARRAGRLPS
jgi:hypothetical protein